MRASDLNLPEGMEVYVDMDGVVADFFTEYAKLAGVTHGNYRDIPPAKVDPTLDKMVGTDFFARLPKFPTADQLLQIVVDAAGSYNICSSPLRGDHEGSAKYKNIWIKKHLNPQPKHIYIVANKAKYAKSSNGMPNVLIDDRGSNISAWEAAGGIGIKYQADEDSLKVILEGLKRARRVAKGEQDHEPQKLQSLDRGKMIAVHSSGDKDESLEQEGFMSFLKSEPPKKKWDAAKDSRVVSNRKDDDAWIKLLLDKHRRGIELTDREWDSIKQWKLKRDMRGESVDEGWKDIAAAGALATGLAFGHAGDAEAKPKNHERPAVTQQAKAPAKKVSPAEAEAILRKVATKAGIQGTELAQFMAQCQHETLNFTKMKEIGGSLDFKKYDPKHAPRKAKILGNTKAGDGSRYAGRGFIQLTGRDNYKKAGDALGLPLEKHPEMVENPMTAAKVAVWYWKNRVQAKVANFNDTAEVTKHINPALRGLDSRQTAFKDYKLQVAQR